jgi:hypothetical protein
VGIDGSPIALDAAEVGADLARSISTDLALKPPRFARERRRSGDARRLLPCPRGSNVRLIRPTKCGSTGARNCPRIALQECSEPNLDEGDDVNRTNFAIATLALVAQLAGCKSKPPTQAASTTPISLPSGAPGVGFDDLRYSRTLGKIIAPAGRSGRVDLIDPASRAVTEVGGFSAGDAYDGGHDFGATSADERGGMLFVTDRTSQKIVAVDVASRMVRAAAALSSSPDYVRAVKDTEVWVTEPDSERIEVFTFSGSASPMLARSAFIPVAGGPESLVIDPTRARAYTHLWNGKTVSIDLGTQAIVETWSNDCEGSRGIALDEARGFLFAGCSEGKGVVLDVAHQGKVLASLSQGSGVDVIDFGAKRSHLYLPGSETGTMAILGVSSAGTLTLLGNVETTEGAHCVATDDDGRVFVCDPNHGRLIEIDDPFPSSR